jgi:XTP/dITP diphosphohydrolase
MIYRIVFSWLAGCYVHVSAMDFNFGNCDCRSHGHVRDLYYQRTCPRERSSLLRQIVCWRSREHGTRHWLLLHFRAMPSLVLGTRNRKKGEELGELLDPWGFELLTLADLPEAVEIEETGETFAANAALKACEQAKHLHRWVLGEDSGLVVNALGGEPGVYSARYSGPKATDESNNVLLLARLGNTPIERRTAHYVCHAALSDPGGTIRAQIEGECRGRIRFAPAGSSGFGYDPLFEIVEYHRTFGELGPAVKACLSHRARAIRGLIPAMLRLVDSGVWL